MAPTWFAQAFILPEKTAAGPETEVAAPPDADATWFCFAEAANSRLAELLIVGWSPDALRIWQATAAFRGRRTVWAAQPQDMRRLLDDLSGADVDGDDLRLATLRDESSLPDLIARLPYAWSLVCLGSLDQRSVIREIHRLMLIRTLARADRFRLDLVHLFRRQARRPDSVSLAALRGAAAGRAALCLAAGPGLDGGLEQIRRWQDRAVVIAADVIAGRVCDAGIRVDFVVNLDSHDRLAGSLGRAGEACLVMPLNGNDAFDLGRRHTVFVCDDGLTDALAPGIGGYVHGTNVGSGTVGFAMHLGCAELVLFGHDLSFGTGAYYATGIEGGIEALSRSAADATQVRIVDGNAGPVTTNMQFGMGIQDLAVMLQTRPHLRAMNHNINLGRGARIPGTVAVPDAWEPPGEAWNGIPEDRMERIPWPIPELEKHTIAALDSFQELWERRRSEGVDLISRWDLVGGSTDADLLLGRALTDPVLAGWVLDAIRLRGKGSDAAIEAGVRELEGIAEAGLGLWVGLIRADMRELPADLPSYVQPPADPWLVAFSPLVASELTPFPRGSVDEVLARYLGRDRGILRRLFPTLGLPRGGDPSDLAMALVTASGGSPLDWARLVAAIAVQRPDAPIVQEARRRGLPEPADGACALIDACRAFTRLQAGAAVPDRDLRLACSDPWVRPAAVAWALRSGAGAVLGQALVGQDPGIDDGCCAGLVSGMPDVLAAVELVERVGGVCGARTALASAGRLLQISAFDAAERELAQIPPLDPRAAEALAMRLACAHASGIDGRFDAVLLAVPWRDLMFRGLWRFLAGHLGEEAACRQFAVFDGQRIPLDVLAEIVGHAVSNQPMRDMDPAVLARWVACAANPPRPDVDPETCRCLLEIIRRLGATP